MIVPLPAAARECTLAYRPFVPDTLLFAHACRIIRLRMLQVFPTLVKLLNIGAGGSTLRMAHPVHAIRHLESQNSMRARSRLEAEADFG